MCVTGKLDSIGPKSSVAFLSLTSHSSALVHTHTNTKRHLEEGVAQTLPQAQAQARAQNQDKVTHAGG